MSRQLLAIINPISGTGNRKNLERSLQQLARETKLKIEIYFTEYRGHAQHLAAEAAQKGFAAVIACGGDGTVNEVINGLGIAGLPLLLIPQGTGNALAREIRAFKNPLQYKQSLLEWRLVKRDLGRLKDGKLFACFVGAGFEAECARLFQAERPISTPIWKYVPLILSILWRAIQRTQFSTICVTLDQRQIIENNSWAFIALSPHFGGSIQFVKNAIPNDGQFDIMIRKRSISLSSVSQLLVLGFLKRTHWIKDALFFKAKKISLTAFEPNDILVPIHVDGDPAGYLPVEVEIVPDGLTLFMAG